MLPTATEVAPTARRASTVACIMVIAGTPVSAVISSVTFWSVPTPGMKVPGAPHWTIRSTLAVASCRDASSTWPIMTRSPSASTRGTMVRASAKATPVGATERHSSAPSIAVAGRICPIRARQPSSIWHFS